MGHWRCHDGGPGRAWKYGGEIFSLVGAVSDLGKVATHMLLIKETIGSGDGDFDFAQRSNDHFEGACAGSDWAAACLAANDVTRLR